MNGSKLLKELKQTKPFDSPTTELIIHVMKTHEHLVGGLADVFKSRGLSLTQYNVLRILAGADPDGLPCREIRERTVNRVPDITRLVDRLETKGLARRARSAHDRRVIHIQITGAGLELLNELRQPVLDCQQRLLGHLAGNEMETLCALLEKIRSRTG